MGASLCVWISGAHPPLQVDGLQDEMTPQHHVGWFHVLCFKVLVNCSGTSDLPLVPPVDPSSNLDFISLGACLSSTGTPGFLPRQAHAHWISRADGRKKLCLLIVVILLAFLGSDESASFLLC